MCGNECENVQQEHCTFDVHKDQCYLRATFESYSVQEKPASSPSLPYIPSGLGTLICNLIPSSFIGRLCPGRRSVYIIRV